MGVKLGFKGIDFHVGISLDVSIMEQDLTWWDICLLAEVSENMMGFILACVLPHVSHCTLVQVYTELLPHAHSHSYFHILGCLFKQIQTGV